MSMKILGVAALALTVSACTSTSGFSVVTVTGTTLGLSVGQNAQGTGVDTVLGYKRAEYAFVPTNRSSGPGQPHHGDGAADSPNVLMELYYGGTANSTIYQRLAIGDKAVEQGGATALFIRDKDGSVDAKTAAAVKAIENLDDDFSDN
ncbi:hypothetical protein [Elongatibacter sediminis]|uniref:Lipoprotein n=1 Tax=Elongatibacter sediminis TaxID=3119006 RepID=A0AAW9RJ22_9GAMM